MSSSLRLLAPWLLCLIALLAPASAYAQTTALFVQSDLLDPIGSGVTQSWTRASAISAYVSATRGSQPARVAFSVFEQQVWRFDFGLGGNTLLAPGLYALGARDGLDFGPQLTVSRDHMMCTGGTGRVLIHEVAIDASFTVNRLAADIEYHCDDRDAAFYAAIRYQSTVSALVPFGGAYPIYQLSIAPTPHGMVTGPGLVCGGGAAACGLALGAPQTLMLTATPDPGYVFAGWSGPCGTTPTATVRVNSAKGCAAWFEPAVAVAPRNLFLLDSTPLDPVGQGQKVAISGQTGRFVASRNYRNGVTIEVTGPTQRWTLELADGGLAPLQVGEYLSVGDYSRPFGAGFRVRRFLGNYCNDPNGRFVVHDIAYGVDGSVLRFAADVEQHCSDSAEALYAAIRYASPSDATIFNGAYPEFSLTVPDPGHGRITGIGLDCGMGGALCQRAFTQATPVTLTATPDAGYLFGGWTGACSGGGQTTTVAVNSRRSCAATFLPLMPSVPQSVLVIDSLPGDFVGQGRKVVHAAPAAVFTPSVWSNNLVEMGVEGTNLRWSLDFSGFQLPLTVGSYAPATRASFTPFAGLDISGDSRGCNNVTGYFVVREVGYAQDGSLTRLAIDAEQHCEDATPSLVVALRYNSTITPVPFDGVLRPMQLTIATPLHGVVRGTDIDCGGGQLSCSRDVTTVTTVNLQAVPDSGYIFTGWTGACQGGESTSVKVNMRKACGATFEPRVALDPRTLLLVESAGGALAGNRDYAYSPANSRWTVVPTGAARGVTVFVEAVGERDSVDWFITLEAASGTVLAPGTYTITPGSPFGAPRLYLSYDHGTCSEVAGTFTVHEVTRDPLTGAVLTFAADFEHRCETTSAPAMRGVIRYNSAFRLPPRMAASRSTVVFGAMRSVAGIVRLITPPQPLGLSQTGDGSIVWTARPRQPWITVSPASGTGSATLTVQVIPSLVPSTGLNTTYIDIAMTGAGNAIAPIEVSVRVAPLGRATPVDLDADGAADLALFRPGNGNWMLRTSSTDFASGPDLPFGLPTDKPAPGDYDGDGRNDVAVWRPSNGIWYVILSSSGSLVQLQWGVSTDIPIQADYTGDGRTDLAVWRPANGVWYIFDLSTGTYTSRQWGVSSDIPLTGDYDGDGKADVAAFRPSNGYWYVFHSSTQSYVVYQWGVSTDIPLPGDYNGDGKTDLAVFRPSNGYWFVFDLHTGTYGTYQWGASSDVPAPNDYDGDGRADLAVWREATSQWLLYFLGTNTWRAVTHGAAGDRPIR